ncbi:Uncharacterized protein Adt_30053 [Abeliophyllum distichum]|uniref:Uncharacterized protein n=1 Tax=Abeliophyllum distichum TaxID=126358 RepID=A0ABD1RA55_9LAMI
MRDGCDGVIDQMFPRVRGYGGDESSYDNNGSDSTTESLVFKLPSRNSFCMNNRHKYSSSGLIESFVSRDTKRLSEMREATWRSQDEKVIGKGSKLGKMLGMPDREIRPKHLNAMLILDGASDRAASINGSPVWDGPLGISSSVKTLSRSRSLPSSSFSRRNHIRNAHCEVISEDPYLKLSGTSRGTSKFVKENTNWNEHLSMKASARGKKILPCYNTFICETDYSPETNLKIEMEMNLEGDSSEYQPMVSQIGKSPVPDAVIDTAHGALSLKSTELLPVLLCSKVENDNSSACNQEDSSIQVWIFTCFDQNP